MVQLIAFIFWFWLTTLNLSISSHTMDPLSDDWHGEAVLGMVMNSTDLMCRASEGGGFRFPFLWQRMYHTTYQPYSKGVVTTKCEHLAEVSSNPVFWEYQPAVCLILWVLHKSSRNIIQTLLQPTYHDVTHVTSRFKNAIHSVKWQPGFLPNILHIF